MINLFNIIMKNIQLLLLIFIISLGVNAQPLQDDFEGGGNIMSWFGDNCVVNLNLNNPYPTGLNTSSKVLEYIDNGGQYANLRFDAGRNLNLSSFYKFSFKIYVPSNSITGNALNQVSLKLQDGNLPAPWSTQSEIIKPIQLDQWQVVTFDFVNDSYQNLNASSLPPSQRMDFNRIIIQVNGENNFDFVTAYIDDFYYFDSVISQPPLPVYNRLVWSDEFNGSGAIDGNKWFHQTQLPNGGSWYNGEIQHYTNRTANASVNNGIMNLIARKELFVDQGITKQYTSARLNSKFAFKYGKIEVRAKLPSGIGTWPAIWMLGKNIDEPGAWWQINGHGSVGWPACGEIDIMEHWGTNQNYVQSATHTPSSFGNTINHGGQTISTASTAFHTYTLEWYPSKLVFSVDNVVHYTYEPSVFNSSTWPFNSEQYILLNIAILPSISSMFNQSSMDIDYVRVYQESTTHVSKNHDDNSQFNIYPNPVIDNLTIKIPNEKSNNLVNITIFNSKGQLVFKADEMVNNGLINLSGLQDFKRGVYFLSVNYDSERYNFKFIK